MKETVVTELEQIALDELTKSADPMARVIYHMSMRQLAMCEQLMEVQRGLKQVIEFVDKNVSRPSNGSIPPLSLVMGEHGNLP